MTRPHTLLFNAADELPSGSAAATPPAAQTPTVADAIHAIDDKTLTISQRLSVAANALRGIDPTGQLANIKAELDKAKLDLSARDEEITTLKASLADLEKQVTAREKDLEAADAARVAAEKTAADLQAKEQDLDKRASAKAKEKLGALGIASTELPKADNKPAGDEKAEAQAAIRKLSGTQRTKAALYFQAHGTLPDWMSN